jgi:uncharacterized protein
MAQQTAIDQAVLDDIVRRIVEVAQPERIILFGSAARGELGPHSELDLLVIKGGEYRPGELTDDIYRGISGVAYAVDVIVATLEHVERYRDSHPLVIKPALKEGLVVFDEPSNWVPGKVGPSEVSGRLAPDDPRAWINRARSNLISGRTRTPGVHLEDLCFQLQQAAKQAIKAVHIARNIEFPYTHDLDKLVKLLDDAGEIVPEAMRKADKLSKFAVTLRYPTSLGSVTEEDYHEAVAIAEAVVSWADERVRTYLAAEEGASK